MKARIAVLGGDGIGPEVVAEGLRCLEAIGSSFEHEFALTQLPFGGAALIPLIRVIIMFVLRKLELLQNQENFSKKISIFGGAILTVGASLCLVTASVALKQKARYGALFMFFAAAFLVTILATFLLVKVYDVLFKVDQGMDLGVLKNKFYWDVANKAILWVLLISCIPLYIELDNNGPWRYYSFRIIEHVEELFLQFSAFMVARTRLKSGNYCTTLFCEKESTDYQRFPDT